MDVPAGWDAGIHADYCARIRFLSAAIEICPLFLYNGSTRKEV